MNAVAASPRSFSLHVFRIEEGLGNACLLRLPDGRFSVIDWGTRHPPSVAAAFERIGNNGLAFVAATHAHADHTLGLPTFFREASQRGLSIERFAYPVTSLHKRNAHLTRARLAAVDLGIPCSTVNVDEFETADGPMPPPALAFGDGWEVRVLSPGCTTIGRSEVKAMQKEVVPGNETSLVILFRFYGGIEAGRGLLTGDAEKATLDFALRTAERFPHLSLRNDCFVVPHHGARNGVPGWLLEISRGAIVISGRTDSDHHPSRETLMTVARRCADSGGNLYCTSYAQACRETYRPHVGRESRRMVAPGRCFGDFVIEVDDLRGARLAASSDHGEARRAYGLCRVSSPLPADGGAASRQP